MTMVSTRTPSRFTIRAAFVAVWLSATGFLAQLSPVLAADSNTYALLINGGGSRGINYQSHLLHIERMHELLRDAGVPESRISILSADGSDPNADLATRAVQQEQDFWLLYGTRLERSLRPRIKYTNSILPESAHIEAATYINLRKWFEDAANTLGRGDTLLIYVTDHGRLNEDDAKNNQIVLWGKDENINVEELGELIDMLQPSVRVVALMSQCYSGSFANLIFARPDGLLPRPNLSGFFSSTSDRPAYGCYPENRDKDNVGHSFRFFDALANGGSFAAAHREVLITDRTPDVPLRASDLYLDSVVRATAAARDVAFDDFVDQLLREAWRNKATWEPEIRLLDRMGETFGFFSPRYLSELDQQSEALIDTGKRIEDYEAAWKRALASLNRVNLERFLAAHANDWDARLEEGGVAALTEPQRRDLTAKLLAELAAFTRADESTQNRLDLLRQKAEATGAASYRLEVREGAVLRMRTILVSIAGQHLVSQEGLEAEREAHRNLAEHEAFALETGRNGPSRIADVEPFPAFVDEIALAEAALPGWMGIQFRPPSEKQRNEYDLDDGAVAVMAVYPDSPAQKAGLEPGDIILGRPEASFTERDFVREWVMTAPIGEAQPLQVRRGQDVLALSLTPEAYPSVWPDLPGPPKVGSLAPSLDELESFRGKPVSQLTGQGPYMLFFWATWCGPCKAALPEVLAFERARGVPVLAITDESAESVRAFLEKFERPFPEAVVLDENRQSFLAYGVAGTPRFVLVDERGAIESYESGYRASRGLTIEGWEWDREAASAGQ